MRIGIFDSGIGGLFIMKKIIKRLPEYDYVYLGDTKHLPYGDRNPETIYQLLKNGIDFLFKQKCGLIIVACNTASAEALRRIQQEYLPTHYPKRRVLGVIIPAIEESLLGKRVGILATAATVNSKTYEKEFKKINPRIRVYQQPAPLLVPFIENAEWHLIMPVLKEYLKPLLSKKIDTLILGCTHYPILKKEIKKIIGTDIKLICQDEFIHTKTKEYLARHPEIRDPLTHNGTREFFITEKTPHFEKLAKKWFNSTIKLKVIEVPETKN